MREDIEAAPDAAGALAYAIPYPPARLLPVAPHRLLEAWDLARRAAALWLDGPPRRLVFAAAEGPPLDLLLEDRDALCWAEALDRRMGLETHEGMALLVRLLALVEVLGRAPWMRGLFDIGREGTLLHPALLRAAATEPLDSGARFEEGALRRLLSRPLSAGAPE